ncbi:MAG: gliding motility-associated C-terminal domain-containing protein [Taibaiella sp.]|nr:gliding motility-associated C-terminal domain-containing protein [Taibaiella sp.]
MKKVLLFLFLLFFQVSSLQAQLNLNVTDTTVCRNTPIQVCANIPPVNLSGLNFDDRFSGAINIGFPFVFYGQTVTQCLISENNFITFDLGFANSQSANYTYNNSLNSGELNRAILFPYQDLDVSFGGVIRYMTVGQAPNRKFVVEFCDVVYYSNSCHNLKTRNQLILYEGSNEIEMHLGQVAYCSGWPITGPNGHAVQGIRGNGNQLFVAGRAPNSAAWTVNSAAPEGHRFVPTGAGNYTLSTVAYNPVAFIQQNQGTYSWYSGNATSPFANTVCATITPDTAIDYYVVKYTGLVGCGATNPSTLFDTVRVNYQPVQAIKSLNYCASQLPVTWNGITIPAGTSSNANYDTVMVYGAANACDTNFIINLTVIPGDTPVFTQVPPQCAGAVIPSLPLTSNNGITGNWSPAINNSQTTTYTFTPAAGQCAPAVTMTIVVNPVVTPAFTPVGTVCAGTTLAALPLISNNGVTGTWSPALNNTQTTTYTFTPTAGQCATTATLTIVVNPVLTPSFSQVPAICSGAALSPLPTTSLNGVTGTWSPALNNSQTTTYTFSPASGQCAASTTMAITVNPNVVPAFNAVAPICAGESLSALPTTSLNGVTGTWSPALNNTATTTYTFTPASGQCAGSTTMTITVNPSVVPAFTQVAPICSGTTLAALPLISNNGITGTWSPAINNTQTTTYTFTPAAGQCAATTTMTIVVNPVLTPSFTQVPAICTGGTLSPLPITSNNGISGTWSPALNNTQTTTYTFTPAAGQCAGSTTMTINVSPTVVPAFNAVAPICAGAGLSALPTTSTNGITGTWSPALNNTATTTYTFTPNPGQCGSPVQLTIQVIPNTTPVFTPVAPICPGTVLNPLPGTSNNGITGTWSPALNNMATTTYTFTPAAGQTCVLPATMQIAVQPYLTGQRNVQLCEGSTYTFNGITYTTSVSGVNDTIPNTGTCDSIITLNLVIHPRTYGTQQATICDGSSYLFNGQYYTGNNNTAKDTLINQWGCDSIVTLNLNVIPVNPVTASETAEGCGSLTYNGQQYTTSTQFTDTLTNVFGCDSVYKTVNLIVFPEYHDTLRLDVFGCDSALYNQERYYASTQLTEVFQTSHGCDSLVKIVTIEVHQFDLATVVSPERPYAGEAFTIEAFAANNVAFEVLSWTPASLFPDQAAKLQRIALNEPVQIVVTGNSNGCLDTAMVNVGDLPTYSTDVQMPNAFSPNGDGKNDVFRPVFKIDRAYTIDHFTVYNRYGQLIYTTSNMNSGWDGYYKGRLQDQGVYYYIVKISFMDGTEKTLKGDVTLIR